MIEISKKSLSEAELLKEIYKKLSGDNPALDLNKALSKATLLRGIADLNLGGGSSLEIVQDIPTTLNPGQKVWCVATQSEWIGADPDNYIFPTLSMGTAWPAIGYKSLFIKLFYPGTNLSEFLRADFPSSDLTLTRRGVGIYDVSILNQDFSVDILQLSGIQSQSGGGVSTKQSFYLTSSILTIYKRKTSDDTPSDSDTSLIEVKIFPPVS
jgi:hypothetical protein